MRIEYEKPTIELTLFYSREPMAEEQEPDGPSGVDEGFEVWPDN